MGCATGLSRDGKSGAANPPAPPARPSKLRAVCETDMAPGEAEDASV